MKLVLIRYISQYVHNIISTCNIKVINELCLINEVFDSIFHTKCTNSCYVLHIMAHFISDKPCCMLNSYMWLVAAILYYVDSNSIEWQVEWILKF